MELQRVRGVWWRTHHAVCALYKRHSKHFLKNTDANTWSECSAAGKFIANKNGFGSCVSEAVSC
jgi:hypothetical protein